MKTKKENLIKVQNNKGVAPRKKTIKSKIITAIVANVAISLILVGGISAFMTYNNTVSTLENTMAELATVASERVAWELSAYKNIAIEVGSTQELANPEIATDEKKSIIDQRAKTHGFESGNVIGLDGKSIFDGTDFSDREYVKAAFKGEASVSDPVVSKVTGKLAIIIAAPLWENGVPNSRVVGAVYFAPKEDFLNQIMTSINISEHSGAYILDKEGNTIADVKMDTVLANQNIEVMSETDLQLKEIAVMHADMRQGGSGFGIYKISGNSKFLAYAPIANSNGWSLGVNAFTNDFMQATINSVIATIILLILSIMAAFVIAAVVGGKISKPITLCTDRLSLLSVGDLRTPVPTVKTNDETQTLAEGTAIIVNGLSGIIGDLDTVLHGITAGDLSVATSVPYPGEFAALETLIAQVIQDLNTTMTQVNVAADEVLSGSNQVSDGAQALSQGATEQASAIEELSATIAEMTEQIKQNAQHVKNADKIIEATANEVGNCDEKMHAMVAAMKDISEKSGEISKIIKTIDDIAFQTNILALNAAVEAARAGSAGKGFAVVADEVRNLAQKSAEAAKITTELIEGSITAVASGAKIAQETAGSLGIIVVNAKQISATVDEISVASDQQADGAGQITIGVDQIASVIQTNSATAEESAAASEELSSQAALLKQLVSKFKTKEIVPVTYTKEKEYYAPIVPEQTEPVRRTEIYKAPEHHPQPKPAEEPKPVEEPKPAEEPKPIAPKKQEVRKAEKPQKQEVRKTEERRPAETHTEPNPVAPCTKQEKVDNFQPSKPAHTPTYKANNNGNDKY